MAAPAHILKDIHRLKRHIKDLEAKLEQGPKAHKAHQLKVSAAEETLRRAAAQRGAEPKVRQNLALVVGLEGRFQEAETIAKGDLSPAEASANVAYLRQMLAQQSDWKKNKRNSPLTPSS